MPIWSELSSLYTFWNKWSLKLQEMTLEEYEKVLVEKRKALHDLKIEGRKVDVKEFESMQQLANKKNNDDIFIKLVNLFNLFSVFIFMLVTLLYLSLTCSSKCMSM